MKLRFFLGIFLAISFFPVTSIAQNSAASLLEELDLNSSQRAAIQAVLLGGMQSLNAINAELEQYESEAFSSLSDELTSMRQDLLYQRMQLAESMAFEILDVLSEEQRSKLNFGSLIDSLPSEKQESESLVREFEI